MQTSISTADTAVVLGAAVEGDRPTPVFQARIDHAIDLLQAGRVQHLIFTGGMGEGETFAESEVAQAYAIEQGVAEKQISIETSSQTTFENLQESVKLLDRQGQDSVIVVSDPLHLARAQAMMDRLNIKGVASATPYSRYQSWPTQLPFLLREVYFWHHHTITGQ